MSDFDTELNYGIHNNVQDAQSDVVSDMVGGTVATVTDIGASMWNSLPGTPEVDTADLLGRIDQNALKVYNEHPDLIHTASFIGGMFIPTGLALKGMGMMRNGVKALSWFGEGERAASIAKLGELFGDAASSTAEFRTLQQSVYLKTAVGQAVDAVAAEAALVGLYHAHPYMEDYMKDPVQNFTLSALMGGAIGAGAGAIADRFAIKSAIGAVKEEAVNAATKDYQPVFAGMTNATVLQTQEKNITNLEGIVSAQKALGKDETNDLTTQIAKQMQLTIKAEQAKLFESMVSKDVMTLPTTQRDQIMRMVIDKPEMFGVENVRFLTEKDITSEKLLKAPKKGLSTEPTMEATVSTAADGTKGIAVADHPAGGFGSGSNIPGFIADKTSGEFIYPKNLLVGSDINDLVQKLGQNAKTGFDDLILTAADHGYDAVAFKDSYTGHLTYLTTQAYAPGQSVLKTLGKDAVYFPEFNLYGIKSDAKHYAGASTLGLSAEKLAKNLPYNYGKIPNLDSSLELAARGSAELEGEYIAAMTRVKDMSIKDLEKLHVSETDGPLLNAVVMRMLRDPEAANVVIKTSDRSPVYQAVIKKQTEELIAAGKLPKAVGPDSSYKQFVDKLAGRISDFKPDGSVHVDGTNYHLSSLISDWIGGDKMTWNERALHHLASATGGYAKTGVDDAKAKVFAAIYDSKQSQALRAEFMKIADADGNVFLYRGWGTDKIKGKQMLDSYTTHPEKAAQFSGAKYGSAASGRVRLYKVPVDDIVAGFKDIGGGKYNDEIIVRASARNAEVELDASGMNVLKQNMESSAPGSITKQTTTTTTTEVNDLGSKQSGLADLQNMLIAQKQDAMDTLLANGIPFESIAKKTNTDIGVVKAYAAMKTASPEPVFTTGTSLADLIPPNKAATSALNNIKSFEQIEEVLNPTNQPLVLKGNIRKNKLYTENHIALNNREMKTLNSEFIFNVLNGSNAPAAKELAATLYGPEGLGKGLDILAARIGKMSNELAGSAFFNSFDAFTRNMGDVGPIVSSMGKKVQQISNNMIRSVTTPIVDAMTAVTKDAAALVEYSTFYNLNATLKGWRGVTAKGKLVQKAMKENAEGKMVEVLEPVKYMDKDYQVITESVRDLILQQQTKSGELKSLADALNKIKGTPPINDIGLWIPSFNPVNKFIAYVHNKVEDTTKLLIARSAKEYDEMVRNYRQMLKESGQEDIHVVTKGEQADWNLLNGRLDPINMERADIGMQKTGSSSAAVIKPDLTLFGEIAGGYEHYITAQVRNMTDLSLSEITDPLRKMSDWNQRLVKNQPLSEVKKAVTQPKDTAAVIRNVLLGGSNLGEYAGWSKINQSFETILNMAGNAVSDVWDATVKPLTTSMLGKNKDLTIGAVKKIDYVKFTKELEDRGIAYPWKMFDEAAAEQFGADKAWFAMPEDKARKMGFFSLERNPDATKRVVYGSNALAATMALRFGELAQPLVNMLSLPVLTGLAIAQKMPESFMGVQKATSNVSGVQVMYEGIRAMHSPQFAALNQRWEREGVFSPMVSEASNIIRATRQFDKGPVAAIENALDSKIVQVMSKPADLAESLTRKAAMNTGAVLAKRLYPELDDTGITIFARDFLDKAIGNFHASQRPVMFQGTLGVALGLFQTYTLTLGQSIYRHLELKNYKALGKAALAQSTLFGGKSMPGFDMVSQAIGDHFSDDNVDLTTGTYRALSDPVANFALYGLPSNMPFIHPALNTRGDVNPRLPLLNNTPVAMNVVSQIMGTLNNVKTALANNDGSRAQAFAQALSLQNMSRPVARLAELSTGYSMTQRGNTVQTPEEVWTFQGIASRIMATRPMEEEKLREADHLNHFYGALDRDNREKLMNEIRTSVRTGTLTNERIASLSDGYFRHGGSPAGWRAAVNTAIAKTDAPGKEGFIEKLKVNNPINFMINNLD